MRIRRHIATRLGAVLAVTAATVLGTAVPSYAAPALTIFPTAGPAAGGFTMNISGITFPAGQYVEFNKSGTCPLTYATPATGTIVAATPLTYTANATNINVSVPALTGTGWVVCTYAGNTAGSSGVSGQSSSTFTPFTTAPTTLTTSPAIGVVGGGNTITVTDPAGFGIGTTVEFNASACPATYATASGTVFPATVGTITPGTTLSVTVPSGMTATASYYVCAYSGSTGSSVLLTGTSASHTYSFYPILSLSAYTGVSGGNNSIIGSATGTNFQSGAAVLFHPVSTGTPCPATFPTSGSPITATGTAVRVVSPTRVAITVPTGVVSNGVGPSYNVCVYSGSTGSDTQLAATTSPYVVGGQAAVTGVSPSSGPAQGGTVITVTGQNLFAAGSTITGTVGGLPLTQVTPVGSGGTTFTAVTPAHAAGGPFAITVATPANGTASMVGVFTYTNGIQVTPNVGSNGQNIDIDVTGVGFSSIAWTGTGGDTPDDAASGHVYLVRGAYDPTPLRTGFKANGEMLECVSVLFISDGELVCTLHLSGDVRPTGFRTSDVAIADGNILAGSDVLVSANTTFAATDIGMAVTSVALPGGAEIVSVLDAHTVVLSAKAITDLANGAATLAATRAVTGTSTISGTTVTNAGANSFTSADVGRSISGPGIPGGTYISTVTDANTVTISQQAQSTTGAVKIAVPSVPVGVYTITVVSTGKVGAPTGTYTQSVISSGSTFTVAPY
jgi:hypothetical protein